jgi:hypothetical protein
MGTITLADAAGAGSEHQPAIPARSAEPGSFKFFFNIEALP